MDPRDDQPAVEFLLVFVKPADGAQPRQVRYCRYGAAGKLEPVDCDGSAWEEESQ
jgi:hypothetical protein